jgi:Zn-finger nucleic acid-binding protein
MIEETHHNVAIDRCQRCHGYWFDIDEIQKYLLSRGVQRGQWIPRPHELEAGEQGNPAVCTCCGNRELRERLHRGVSFLTCSWCGGTFLAKSELAKFKPSPVEYSTPQPQSSPIPPIDPTTQFDTVDIVLLILEAIFHIVLD